MTKLTNRRRSSLQVNAVKPSGVGRGCARGGDHCEQGVRDHREQVPALPGDPPADLVFVEPGQALAGLERLLDGPAASGGAVQLG
jgi:hypothetical protein